MLLHLLFPYKIFGVFVENFLKNRLLNWVVVLRIIVLVGALALSDKRHVITNSRFPTFFNLGFGN